MKNSDLRDQMLDLEPYPEDLKMKIHAELDSLKERPMGPWERIQTALGCVLVLVVASVGLYVISTRDNINETPTHSLVGMGLIFVGVFGSFVWGLRQMKKGSVNASSERLVVGGIAVSLFLLSAKQFYLNGSLNGTGMFMVLTGGVAAFALRLDVIELRLRERVLRNELALVELTELVTEQRAGHDKLNSPPGE